MKWPFHASTEAEIDECSIFYCFTSGAKFGIIVGLLTYLVSKL